MRSSSDWARRATPGQELSRGPATFRIRTLDAISQRRSAGPSTTPARSTNRSGLPCCCANRLVKAVPDVSGPWCRIKVASESRMFFSVRMSYRDDSVSRNRNRGGTCPSSDRLPRGHQPPWGTPSARAASSAPRSTPVCPPETTRTTGQPGNSSTAAFAGCSECSATAWISVTGVVPRPATERCGCGGCAPVPTRLPRSASWSKAPIADRLGTPASPVGPRGCGN